MFREYPFNEIDVRYEIIFPDFSTFKNEMGKWVLIFTQTPAQATGRRKIKLSENILLII